MPVTWARAGLALCGPARAHETGIVLSWDEAKGFGFIKPNGSSQSVFAHASALLQPVRANDRVQYELKVGGKTPTAVNVKLQYRP